MNIMQTPGFTYLNIYLITVLLAVFSSYISINSLISYTGDQLLRHTTIKTINAPLTYCTRCVRDPERFLSNSKYTYTVRRLSDNTYEVVFRWVKWGIERFYKVVITVEWKGNTVTYRSTDKSPYYFYIRFRMESPRSYITRVTVESGMKAGLMADLLGRGDYREFIEELVEKGIAGMARKLAESLGLVTPSSRIDCRDCILYDEQRRYCYALRTNIRDPMNPPCNIEYYISKKLIKAELGEQ